MNTAIKNTIIRNTGMDKKSIFNILQFAGGTFPGGGFSQSWGLETYVEKGVVTDIDSLNGFLTVYIETVLAKSEVPIMVSSMKAFSAGDSSRLDDLEELSVASKLTGESRESTLRMGNAFMRISAASLEDTRISDIFSRYKGTGITYPVAYGIVMEHLGMTDSDAAGSYIFSAVNAVVQSAVKLIPLGNTEAQTVIHRLQNKMDDAVDGALATEAEEIVTFSPGLDIAGMEHEIIPVRLYMT